MSFQRCLAPTSTSSLFKLASLAISQPARSCPHAGRQFTSSSSIQLASKRKLVTLTAYHPSSLESNLPPPPRNSGIPDTSIAGTVPQLNDIRPPLHTQPEKSPSISLTEHEAQKTKAVASSRGASTSTTPPPSPEKPRRKLRPRKAAMSLTPSAIRHLRDLLSLPEPKLIRVGVKNKGCSGLAYSLEYVDKPGLFDEEVEQDGVKVLVDSKALLTIIGSEMDWVEDKLEERFVFRNPNIKEQCGCGESFMV